MSWLPKQTVIVPVDFSDTSFDSLAEALKLVDKPQDVHVVHVLPDLPVTDPGVIWDTVDDESRMQHALEAMEERLANAGYADAETTVRIGDPGSQIVEFAEESHADLIVISSHGRSGLKHLLMGSVAERVVRLAHCPVLVLKATA